MCSLSPLFPLGTELILPPLFPVPCRAEPLPRHAQGKAVQVEQTNLVSRAPGTKHLELSHDKLPSSFCSNLNLRRYMKIRHIG